MQANPRKFLTACLAGCALLIAAAVVYSRRYALAPAVAIPVVVAILIEFILYLATGFREIRERFTPPLIVASALVPYLVYSIPTGQFRLPSFLLLAALVAGIAYWYVVLPAIWWADLLFVVYVPAILLSRVLKDTIYILPVRHVQAHVVLGHAMLIHTAVMAILNVRKFEGIGYGFIPTKTEILVGVKNFLFFVPFGAALGLSLHIFKYRGQSPWLAPVLMVGYFWMVALSEELAFRGVLFQTLLRLIRNRYAALAISSVAFGFVHIWFPGGFPNWRMMLLATVAGWFYGRAFEQGGGIRAAMVTHAITVTVWLIWLA